VSPERLALRELPLAASLPEAPLPGVLQLAVSWQPAAMLRAA
jgi:hypothetical protein